MSEPLITIGITCYKEGDWLRECWESVLAQTDERWEAVLVMDGGGDKRTQEIFASLKHPRLRKYRMPRNMGPYPTRNKAFELTQTPYHFYLDGDDQLVPNSLSLVLDTFRCFPDAGFVYGDFQWIGERPEMEKHPSIYRYPHDITPDDLVVGKNPPGPCAYKKFLWQQLGGFALPLARGAADYDFFFGAYEAGIRGRHCGEVFYRYRFNNAGRVSESYFLDYHEKHEIIVRRHPIFFRDFRRRRLFLGWAYKRAARANLAAGNARKGCRLAWSALRCGLWKDFEMWFPALGLPLLPACLYVPLRCAWRLSRQALKIYERSDLVKETRNFGTGTFPSGSGSHTGEVGQEMIDSNRPLVTVVVPHYNQNSYLQDCLQSVISQSLSCWELIVVDDASTQGNPDLILSEFHDARCRLIKHERNRGLAAARNTGFKAATTPYVLPLDADDCLDPSYLEYTLEILLQEPKIDCVFTDLKLFGARAEIWHYEVKSTQEMLNVQWIPGAGTIMRRSLWERIGGYCEAEELCYGNEDWDFWIAAIKLGVQAKHIPKRLYFYRRHGKSVMATRLSLNDHITREYIYSRHRAFFDHYRAGRKFRAKGYLTAANASLYKGQRLRALRLALRGLALSPGLPGLPKLALLAVLPGPLTEMLKAVKGKFRAKTA